ncbi:DUF3644 domain-containing protein [Candidatus Mycalebacterium sp.]
MRSRSRTLADKSISSMIAAIEIYNKPSFEYREESFSILAINAWEILLKARILLIEQNRLSSVFRHERHTLQSGKPSKKLYVAKNHSGSNQTIGLFESFDRLVNQYREPMPQEVRKNLELIYEIRNNAVHFINKGPEISKVVQGLGAACLKNYMNLIRKWFGTDLSIYNFFIMPLSFFSLNGEANSIILSSDEKKVFDFVKKEIKDSVSEGEEGEEYKPESYNVSLKVELKFFRSKEKNIDGLVVSQQKSGTPVTVTEEDLSEKYPWNYQNLTAHLKKRYSNFIQNKEYHQIRQSLESNEQFCKTRYLDIRKQQGLSRKFYNSNIVKEFDNHYVKKE